MNNNTSTVTMPIGEYENLKDTKAKVEDIFNRVTENGVYTLLSAWYLDGDNYRNIFNQKCVVFTNDEAAKILVKDLKRNEEAFNDMVKQYNCLRNELEEIKSKWWYNFFAK